MSAVRLRADYPAARVRRDGHDFVLLLGETRKLAFDDPLTIELIERLDGTRDLPGILDDMAPRHAARSVALAFRRLRGLDVLTARPSGVPPAHAAAWDARQVDPDRAQTWLAGGRVGVVDAGAADLAAVVTQLASFGLRCDVVSPARARSAAFTLDPAGTPVLVVTASMTDPLLGELNRVFLAAGRSWLLLRPQGLVGVVGPHLVPGRTGCWECLRERWSANEQVETFLGAVGPAGRPAVTARFGPLVAAVTSLLAAELPVLEQQGWSDRLSGRVLTLDSRDLTTATHELVRQPHCPACGDAAAPDVRPDLIAPARDEVDLLARLERHVDPYLGVVTRLQSPGPPEGGLVHTYTATHSFTVPSTLDALRVNLRGLSGGKGATDDAARIGAVAEAVERYCGVWQSWRPTTRGTFAQLRPRGAVHLDELLRFAPEQYADRTAINARVSHFHRVPEPMTDDLMMDWTPVWSLTRDAERLVPTAYCWYGHPEARTLGVTGADSNGCAAGSSPADAAVRGFCELVERDSVALWWYHRSLRPRVCLDSVGDPWLDRVRAHLDAELNRDLWVLDITADLGVPAYAAVSAVRGAVHDSVLVGFAAAPDPRAAVVSAVTELGQFLPLVAGLRDGAAHFAPTTASESRRWYTQVRIADEPWLRPDPDQPVRLLPADPPRLGADPAARLAQCVRLAAARGLEVLLLDQSRAELDLSVVRIIVPGLRHFWRRLGPGRLWDVPVRLGRDPLAGGPADANPRSVFF